MKPEIEHCPDARLAFEPLVSVLFARADSVYKALPGVDVWDADRDALTWPGGTPVVAHPPCRAWAGLRHWAKPLPGERNYAIWAVEQVRRFGGVLEHPHKSLLWPECGLPTGITPDAWGGWTLTIDQQWWGHRAQKRTRLYIVGCTPADIPLMPLMIGEATHVVGLWSGRDRMNCRPGCSKLEREATPPMLADWLVDLARRCCSGR